ARPSRSWWPSTAPRSRRTAAPSRPTGSAPPTTRSCPAPPTRRSTASTAAPCPTSRRWSTSTSRQVGRRLRRLGHRDLAALVRRLQGSGAEPLFQPHRRPDVGPLHGPGHDARPRDHARPRHHARPGHDARPGHHADTRGEEQRRQRLLDARFRRQGLRVRRGQVPRRPVAPRRRDGRRPGVHPGRRRVLDRGQRRNGVRLRRRHRPRGDRRRQPVPRRDGDQPVVDAVGQGVLDLHHQGPGGPLRRRGVLRRHVEDRPERADPRLDPHAERQRLLHGRLRRRHLLLRRRQVLRLDGGQEAQRPGPVARALRRRRRLLAGGVGRRHLRLRVRAVQGLDGRRAAVEADHRHGALRRRLPDGGRGRRHLRLLKLAVPRLARLQPAGPPDRVGGGAALMSSTPRFPKLRKGSTVRQCWAGLATAIAIVSSCLAVNGAVQFARADSSGQTWTLYAAGDVARAQTGGDEQTAAIIKAGIAADPDHTRVAMLGDGAYPDGSYHTYLDVYDKTAGLNDGWGQFKDQTYPAPGNHDYGQQMGPLDDGYRQYWDPILQKMDKSNGGDGDTLSDQSGWYSVDIGPSWHLISLNWACTKSQAGTPSP